MTDHLLQSSQDIPAQIRAGSDVISFPLKLHGMLEDSETQGFQDIVAWQPGGRSFKVFNQKRFSTEIMSKYFNQTKYKSFQRQLNIYGFRRIHSGEFRGGYSHQFFQRDTPASCKHVIRRPHQAKSDQAKSDVNKLYKARVGSFHFSGSIDLDNAVADIFKMEDSDGSDDLFSMDELLDFSLEDPLIEENNQDIGMEHIFPWKLHQMMEEVETRNLQGIVSWVRDGTAFKVHDSAAFLKQVMPHYFDQSKFESFRRQLNLYGFSRVTRGENRGIYYHKYFLKNDRSLCKEITRQSGKRMSFS